MSTFKRSGIYITCQGCGFTYLPFNDRTRCNCPKCKPELPIDEDEMYLMTEELVKEEVSTEGNEYIYPTWRNYDN